MMHKQVSHTFPNDELIQQLVGKTIAGVNILGFSGLNIFVTRHQTSVIVEGCIIRVRDGVNFDKIHTLWITYLLQAWNGIDFLYQPEIAANFDPESYKSESGFPESTFINTPYMQIIGVKIYGYKHAGSREADEGILHQTPAFTFDAYVESMLALYMKDGSIWAFWPPQTNTEKSGVQIHYFGNHDEFDELFDQKINMFLEPSFTFLRSFGF